MTISLLIVFRKMFGLNLDFSGFNFKVIVLLKLYCSFYVIMHDFSFSGYIYSHAQKLNHLPKIWILTSLENGSIFFITLLCMLKEHCYIMMLLLQPLRVSFLMIWLSWKWECSKLSQVLLLKIWAKKGAIRSGQVKNYYVAWRRVLRKVNIWQTEAQQDCNPSGSHQIQDIW